MGGGHTQHPQGAGARWGDDEGAHPRPWRRGAQVHLVDDDGRRRRHDAARHRSKILERNARLAPPVSAPAVGDNAGRSRLVLSNCDRIDHG